MRLVDSDALMESFENVLGAAPCELNGYEIWEVLNAQEPIDAIPVEWLRKLCAIAKMEINDEMFIDWLIQTWHEEQEAEV